jgi:hypothetical protein
LELLIDALIKCGVDVDTMSLPRVSGYTVAFWNTKLGGRDILQGDPQVRAALPPAVVCNTLAEVVALVATEDNDRGLVVKANSSMGGEGAWVFPPHLPRGLEAFANTSTGYKGRHKRGYGKKGITQISGPYLVEEMVGDVSRNCSPTADFWISDEGHVDLLGIGEQLLYEGVAYHGCRYPIQAEQNRLGRCTELGELICAHLYRRGYRGFVNVDYVLPPGDSVWVAEVNLRQSAEFDQFLVMHRLFGESWRKSMAFVCEEAVPLARVHATTQELERSLAQGFRLGEGQRVLPLAIYGGERTATATLLTIAEDTNTAEALSALVCSNPGDQPSGSNL